MGPGLEGPLRCFHNIPPAWCELAAPDLINTRQQQLLQSRLRPSAIKKTGSSGQVHQQVDRALSRRLARNHRPEERQISGPKKAQQRIGSGARSCSSAGRMGGTPPGLVRGSDLRSGRTSPGLPGFVQLSRRQARSSCSDGNSTGPCRTARPLGMQRSLQRRLLRCHLMVPGAQLIERSLRSSPHCSAGGDTSPVN